MVPDIVSGTSATMFTNMARLNVGTASRAQDKCGLGSWTAHAPLPTGTLFGNLVHRNGCGCTCVRAQRSKHYLTVERGVLDGYGMLQHIRFDFVLIDVGTAI